MDWKPSTAQQIVICFTNVTCITLVSVVVLLHVADWQRMLSRISRNNFSLKKHKAVALICFSVCISIWCILDVVYITGHTHFRLHSVSCFIVNILKTYVVLVIFCLRLGNYVTKIFAVLCFGKHTVSLLVLILMAVLFPAAFLCVLLPAANSIDSIGASCLLLAEDAVHKSILGFMVLCCYYIVVLFCAVIYGKWRSLKTLFPSWELKLERLWKSSLIQSFLAVQPSLWLITLVHGLVKESERNSKPWINYIQSGSLLYMAAVMLIYETLISDQDKRRPFRFQRRKDAAKNAAEASHLEVLSLSSTTNSRLNIAVL